MVRIEIEADGYLVNPKQPYLPRNRTWHEYFEDFYEFSKLSAKQQTALRHDYRIGEKELKKALPLDRLMCSYAHESRHASVFYALLGLKLDADAAEIIEFVEGPSPVSCFRGVRLIGSQQALRELLQAKGLDRQLCFVSYAESALKKAATATVKSRLKEMVLKGEENPDKVDDFLALEAYIIAGCPEIDGFIMELQYGTALAGFPPDSDLFRRIQSEVKRRGIRPAGRQRMKNHS